MLMGRLLTGYAFAFNHRHQRAGHLFHNLYKPMYCYWAVLEQGHSTTAS